jgi:hypothetical protein
VAPGARKGLGVGIRDRLRRLEEESEGEMLVIPQKDGTVKRFPPEAGVAAFMNFMDRLVPRYTHPS